MTRAKSGVPVTAAPAEQAPPAQPQESVQQASTRAMDDDELFPGAEPRIGMTILGLPDKINELEKGAVTTKNT